MLRSFCEIRSQEESHLSTHQYQQVSQGYMAVETGSIFLTVEVDSIMYQCGK